MTVVQDRRTGEVFLLVKLTVRHLLPGHTPTIDSIGVLQGKAEGLGADRSLQFLLPHPIPPPPSPFRVLVSYPDMEASFFPSD